MVHRFFLDPDRIQAGRVHFSPEISRQISRVLRLNPGDQVVILDGQGSEYTVNLENVTPKMVTASILVQQAAEGEPACKITLYAALSQREKFEWILQKCTELGVVSFIPVITERTIVRKPESVSRKTDRWQTILREAAEQSRRGVVPKLAEPQQYSEAVTAACDQNDIVLFLWEDEQERSIREVLPKGLTSVGLFIGPEGGFCEAEVREAIGAGCIAVSLGKRILRMETAAITATALVLHEAGDLR